MSRGAPEGRLKRAPPGSVARIVEERTASPRLQVAPGSSKNVLPPPSPKLPESDEDVSEAPSSSLPVGRRGGGIARGGRRARELVVFVLAPQEALDGDSALLAEGVHLRADGFRIQRFAAELLLERLRRVLAGGLVGCVEDELGVRVRIRARAALEAAL